jgi:hypothetical protein
MPPGHATNPARLARRRALALAALGLVVAIAAGLRAWAGLGDFWLDEVWTWAIVRANVHSAWDVVARVHDENNHFLNTWWMYLLGPDVDWRWYRLPAVLCGTGAVLLCLRAAADGGRWAVAAAAVLTVPSYLLVHYSSEARGYAYLLFFFPAAYLALGRLLPPSGAAPGADAAWTGWRRPAGWGLFGLCCLGGCLGHPAFLYAYAALLAWAAWRVAFARLPAGRKVLALAGPFAAPTLCLAVLWWANLSHLRNGGGPQEEPWDVMAATLSLMAGGPDRGAAVAAVALLVALAVAVEIGLLVRDGDDRWVLWSAMVVVPVLGLLVSGRREVYPRYFLATVLCLLLALAHLAARCARRGVVGRVAAVAALAAVTLGNVSHLARLYRDDRGRPLEALRWIEAHTAGRDVTVGSDQDFRHGMLCYYYQRWLPADKRLVYVDREHWPRQGPEWWLRHSFRQDWDPLPEVTDHLGNRYRRVQQYPYAGLSGWYLAVYHNGNPAVTGPSG